MIHHCVVSHVKGRYVLLINLFPEMVLVKCVCLARGCPKMESPVNKIYAVKGVYSKTMEHVNNVLNIKSLIVINRCVEDNVNRLYV